MTNYVNRTLKAEKEQIEEFSSLMRNTQIMLNCFQEFKKTQLQTGKTADHPEIAFINKKIQEFEKDLQTLNINRPLQNIQQKNPM